MTYQAITLFGGEYMYQIITALTFAFFIGCYQPPAPIPVATINPEDQATVEGYDIMVKNWIGNKVEKLIARWGVPKKSIEINEGKKAIEYFDSLTVPYMFNNFSFPLTSECRTTFIVDKNNFVESVSFYGNRCKAKTKGEQNE